MTITAEELVGKRLAFALAQKPHGLEGQIKIATLWPLMNLEDGSAIDCSPVTFQSYGYVRWYRVPLGSWQDGDLVTGVLQRNKNNGYQVPDKEWYQVLGDKGERANGVVTELISLPIRLSNLHSDLEKPRVFKRPPAGEFYLQCEDSVVGPFKVAPIANATSPSTYRIEPARSAEGDVDVFDRNEFGRCGIRIVRSTPKISSSEYPPVSSPANVYLSEYQIFRRQDLIDSGLSRRVMYLLSDELLIAKACKQIRVGKNWKSLRDELKTLVNAMRADSSEVSKAVIEGLPRLLTDAESMSRVSEQVSQLLLEDDRIKQQIAIEQSKRIEAELVAKAAEIESKARALAEPKLKEIREKETKLRDVSSAIEKANEELQRIEEAKLNAEIQGEDVLNAIKKRLDSQRSELFADLALLAPLFSATEQPISCTSRADEPVSVRDPSQFISQPQGPNPVINSDPMEERQFITDRLHPLLHLHGACLSVRDSEFLHACIVSSRIVGIPHPGWAVAYADAMGEVGSVRTFAASPNWLSFDMAFCGSLAKEWRLAVTDCNRLYLFVLEGIDRCPSHAWLRPWINIAAGWTDCFPDADGTSWPENIRLCITQERSTACFEVPTEVGDWILNFETSESNEAPSEVKQGHFPFHNWQLPKESNEDLAFQGFAKNLEVPQGKPYTRSRTQLGCRLRHALIRLNEDDSGRCEQIVSRRLFRCWSPEQMPK